MGTNRRGIITGKEILTGRAIIDGYIQWGIIEGAK
jgi:hypothetical protein